MPLFRLDPKGPQSAYQTFRIKQPLRTHFRRATCVEVDCERYRHGFKIHTDPRTQVGQRQAFLIRESGTRHTAVKMPDGMVDYLFAPGTMCFERHYRSLFREPLTAITRGDWRTPRDRRQPRIMPAGEWLSRFEEHQGAIAAMVARG